MVWPKTDLINKAHENGVEDIEGYKYTSLLYKNTFNENGNSNNWLILDIEGCKIGTESDGWTTKANRSAIGARVIIHTTNMNISREIIAGKGHGSMDPLQLHFGLGYNISINQIEIHWPSMDVETEQPKITIFDGPIGSNDWYRIVENIGFVGQKGDVNNDEEVNVLDVVSLVNEILYQSYNFEGANFWAADMIKDRLGSKPLVTQIPVGIEASLKGVVDLIKMKAIIWKDETLGAEFETKDIPEDLKESANKYRQELVELAVEQDEKLMEDYLNGKEISEKDLIKCIRKGCLKFDFVPVLTGSAFKNKGVQPLLDAVVDYLPSPQDIGSIKGTIPESEEEMELKFDDKAPFSALAFKVANDPFVGSLTFVRVYSGVLKSGISLLNTVKGARAWI